MQCSQSTSQLSGRYHFEAWVQPGTPVSAAYDQGYTEGLAAAVLEVARLRAEIAAMRERVEKLSTNSH